MDKVKNIANVNWATAGSVVAGLVVFGALVYGIRKLPTNAITAPVKKATDAVTS
jgi:hypothetical protein